MALLKLINDWITEHGGSTILRERLALLREQAESEIRHIERQHSEQISQLNKAHSEEIAKINSSHADKVAQLSAELLQLKNKQNKPSKKGDVCPYCQAPSGQLEKIEPDKTFGDLGLRRGFYHCVGCGNNYDKEFPLPQ